MILSGSWLDYPLVFGAGVIVSFSPCVLPLVPVTLGYIGAQGKGSKYRGLAVSLVYVLGLAVTYSALGLIAVFTGRLFGQVSSHPLTHFLVANIFILLGLVFLGVFDLPVFGVFVQHKMKISGLWSVFLFGMVSGLVVGPCTAPALGAVLLYVGTRQNLVHGITLLFTFAYGVGAILILTAAAGGFLLNFLKSGAWMERVKKLGGLILIGAGEYLLISAGRLWW